VKLQFVILIALILSCSALKAADEGTVRISQDLLNSVSHLNLEIPDRVPRDLKLPVEREWPPLPERTAPWPTYGWSESTPGEQGMNPWILRKAFQYAAQNNSKGVVVTRHGYIVGEWYGSGWNEMTRQQGYSVSKSFTSALIGLLIDDGKIASVNQPVARFVPEWRNWQHGAVRMKNLLSMDSGLRCTPLTELKLVLSFDQNSYAVGLPMDHQPGEVWAYNNAACQVHSEVILNVTGAQAADYASSRL
jgi:hypothetical protein